ncbi:SecDF P1 head subdomain-containing protein [Anabaena sp. UHCC 0451]|uniref:SecDF P1 head subdomain-containing protein n=1 Tax=Anabaena sp. UHCC 0451 TaxID=2055235 RepID=UPI002B21D319|nr:hypothetical protein [Anabaena sp. UHCC 0451]MEA5578018.1 hypothetical protein [Anabaena sp. UHCC 0451]
MQNNSQNQTLRAVLAQRQGKGFSEVEATNILRQLLPQIDQLHQQNQVHGQISLDTIIQNNQQIILIATPTPQPANQINIQQDIYALAIVMIELLTGKVANLLKNADGSWNWEDDCFVSDQFADVINRMIGNSAQGRFNYISEILAAFGLSTPAQPVISSPVNQVVNSQSKNKIAPWKFGLIGVGSMVLVGLAGFGVWNLVSPMRLSVNKKSFICPFDGLELTLEVKPNEEYTTVTSELTEQVGNVLRKRISDIGFKKLEVIPISTNQLLIQLPEVKEMLQYQRLIGDTGQLYFRLQKPNTETQLLALKVSQAEKKAPLNNQNIESTTNKEELAKTNKAIVELFEDNQPPLTGKYVIDAFGEPTSSNDWNIGLKFNKEGGELFANLTKNLAGTGRSIGIFLDDELLSSPSVGPEFAATGITGGNAVITGRFKIQEANELASKIRSGALPAPVVVLKTEKVKNNRCKSN